MITCLSTTNYIYFYRGCLKKVQTTLNEVILQQKRGLQVTRYNSFSTVTTTPSRISGGQSV